MKINWIYQQATNRRYAHVGDESFSIVPAYQLSDSATGYVLQGEGFSKRFKTVSAAKAAALKVLQDS
jgi:hypothetical protein